MKKPLLIIVIILLAAGIFWLIKQNHSGNVTTFKQQSQTSPATTTPMQITSTAFSDGQNIPAKYTCDAAGVNPPLAFSNVPAETKSLALILEDPDTSTGTWYHWLIWNIDPASNSIAENSAPAGAVQGQGSSGQNVYGAPCPPSGTHHYIFNLYALSVKLNIPSYSKAADLQTAMEGNVIEQATLTGLYSRGK